MPFVLVCLTVGFLLVTFGNDTLEIFGRSERVKHPSLSDFKNQWGKFCKKNPATRNITRLQLCIKLENTELSNKIYSYNIIQHHTTP